MTSEVAFVPELIGSNYLAWKRKMIDVLRSKNIWRLVNGEHKKPTAADVLAIWEAKSNQAWGLIGQTVADSLQVSIEVEDNLVQYGKIFPLYLINLMTFLHIIFKRRSLTSNLLTLKELSYILLN